MSIDGVRISQIFRNAVGRERFVSVVIGLCSEAGGRLNLAGFDSFECAKLREAGATRPHMEELQFILEMYRKGQCALRHSHVHTKWTGNSSAKGLRLVVS